MVATSSHPEVLTLTELAGILDISLTTAYDLARKDELPIPTIRVGRQFRFSRRALDRYLDADASVSPANATNHHAQDAA